jgi:hypothetical protein
MPRRSKKKVDAKATKAKGQTYYKAKNGRFYKKITVDGKTKVRFVSNAEATGSISVKPKTKRTRRKPKNPQPDAGGAESLEEKVNEE